MNMRIKTTISKGTVFLLAACILTACVAFIAIILPNQEDADKPTNGYAYTSQQEKESATTVDPEIKEISWNEVPDAIISTDIQTIYYSDIPSDIADTFNASDIESVDLSAVDSINLSEYCNEQDAAGDGLYYDEYVTIYDGIG